MCKYIAGLLAFFSILFLPLALAQDQLEAEEILGWFPEGYYQSIQHLDFSGVSEEGYALFKELVGDIVAKMKEVWPLPDSMVRGVVSATQANLSNYQEVEGEETDEKAVTGKTQQLGNISVSFVDDNGDQVRLELEDRAVELFVFRYEDPDNTLKRAIDAGEISETGEQRFERKVYAFTWRTGGEFYLYPAVTGEVLVSADLPALRRMIDAGMGQGLSVVDDSDQRDFIELVPTLGPSWHKKGIESRLKAQLRMAEKLSAPEEYINEIQERLSKLPVVSCSSSYIGESIINRTTCVYADEEAAKTAYNQLAEQINGLYSKINTLPEPNRSLMMNDRRNRSATRDGNMVIMDLKYDREYLELIKQQREIESRQNEGKK